MKITRRDFLAAAGTASVLTAAIRPAAADELTAGQYPLKLDNVRDGVLYVPKGYKAGVPTPLVVMFHGAGSSGLNTSYTFPLADEFGFIVLAPDSRSELTWDLVLGQYGPDVEFLQERFGRRWAAAASTAIGSRSPATPTARRTRCRSGSALATSLATSSRCRRAC